MTKKEKLLSVINNGNQLLEELSKLEDMDEMRWKIEDLTTIFKKLKNTASKLPSEEIVMVNNKSKIINSIKIIETELPTLEGLTTNCGDREKSDCFYCRNDALYQINAIFAEMGHLKDVIGECSKIEK